MTQFPPAPGFPGSPGSPSEMPPNVDSKVKAPAIALMVVGALATLYYLWNLMQSLLQGQNFVVQQIHQLRQAHMPENFIRFYENSAAIAPYVTAMLILLNLLTVLGGLRMLYRKAWGLAVAAAVIQCIPCMGSACCCLGIPFGIWALVVLFNKDVKASFQSSSL